MRVELDLTEDEVNDLGNIAWTWDEGSVDEGWQTPKRAALREKIEAAIKNSACEMKIWTVNAGGALTVIRAETQEQAALIFGVPLEALKDREKPAEVSINGPAEEVAYHF